MVLLVAAIITGTIIIGCAITLLVWARSVDRDAEEILEMFRERKD